MKTMAHDIKAGKTDDLYEKIANSLTVGVYIIEDGRFAFVNSEFQNISGYKREELQHIRPLDLVHPEDKHRVRQYVKDTGKGKNPTSCRFRVIGKDGQVVWGMETAISISYKGKKATLGHFRNITEFVRAEQALKEAEDNFSRTYQSNPAAFSMRRN
jgi:PAS domain S-box-containing protein